MIYRMLDNYDVKRIKDNICDVDLLLNIIDDMLCNVSDASYDEGYSEGYDQGYMDCEGE